VVRRGVKGLVSPELRVANDVLVAQPWWGSRDFVMRTDSPSSSDRRIFRTGSEDALIPCTDELLQWVGFSPSGSPCSDHRPALQ